MFSTLALVLAEGFWHDPSARTLAYAGFILLVGIFLALDLGVFHRHAHAISMKEAALWSAFWISLGLAFAVFIYFAYERHWLGLGLETAMYNRAAASDPTAKTIIIGTVTGLEAAKQYLAGYVVEKSLAMDNIFVIALVFSYFAVPARYQHRVLFWGILGALIMRGVLIGLGAKLVMSYTWILIVFGVFLLLTSAKMAFFHSEPDPGNNRVVRLVRRLYPVVTFYDGQKFFTRRTTPPSYTTDEHGHLVTLPPEPGSLGRKAITPLFLALIMVEITDLIFAVDSIPAIFAITPDPFIVFTSNIFAILGLRSLYFCLAAAIARFRFLKPALILILAYVGVKLLLLAFPPYIDDVAGWLGQSVDPVRGIKIDTSISLIVVVGLLGGAIVASALVKPKIKPASGE
ncbi:MAG: TerC family protein [Phycisphaeraceae bacterium]|nr:TerC family protein [Phycisphaeraceae bacterium]MCW5754489.1 TerC family protein [Phycisphaeraceae bacterium]